MKTLTMTVDAAAVPAGTVCRVFYADNTFIAETISDGSGVLTFAVDDLWADKLRLNVYIEGVDGGSRPIVTQQTLT